MTETSGWPPAGPDETQGGTPDPAPADVPQAPPVPAEATSEPPVPTVPDAAAPTGSSVLVSSIDSIRDSPAPDPVPPPFIPSEGVASWLRDLLLDLHQRLRNAGY